MTTGHDQAESTVTFAGIRTSLPMEPVTEGARPGLSAFFWWGVLMLVGALVAFVVIRPLPWLRQSDVEAWYVAGACLVTLCFVLGRPSATAFPGWRAADIESAKLRCALIGDLKEHELADVRYFVDLAEAATRRRIVALWWLVGSVWALSAWMVQKGLDREDGSMLATALLPALVSLFFAGLMAAYTRAVGYVYGLSHAVLLARRKQLIQTLDAGRMRQLRTRAGRTPSPHEAMSSKKS